MSFPSLFTWKRGWNKHNLKTGQIFEIKKDVVKILKHMIADISMIAISANISKLLRLFLLIYDKNEKNVEFTDILLYR